MYLNVINLVRFLNFNREKLTRFGIFHPKWLTTLKICLFYLARCYKSKVKLKNLYSKSQVSVNLSILLNLRFQLPLGFCHLLLALQFDWNIYSQRSSHEIIQFCSLINWFLVSKVHSLLSTKLSTKVLQGLKSVLIFL